MIFCVEERERHQKCLVGTLDNTLESKITWPTSQDLFAIDVLKRLFGYQVGEGILFFSIRVTFY
jgi:hypothetical protein